MILKTQKITYRESILVSTFGEKYFLLRFFSKNRKKTMKDIKGYIKECLFFQTDITEFKVLGLMTWTFILAILFTASVL